MSTENLSEKISVNINTSTLSSIDLLVDNGYYSNRSDFINQALRSALQQQQPTVERLIEQNKPSKESGNHWFIGVLGLSAKTLEAMSKEQQPLSISGYGVLMIGSDCPEDLLYRVVTKINIRGKVVCSAAIKNHYGLK